jgi:quercetin dioxygenase-like cupin family protein
MTQRISHVQPSPDPFKKRGPALKSIAMACALLLGVQYAPHSHAAPRAEVKEVVLKDLPDFPGKEGLLLEVLYPPASTDEVHRHDAHAFVYVLEGSIVMQLKGGEPVTLHEGQSFYEGPNDVHIVGRNASNTKPARFVVFLVKNKGAPVVTPVH